MQHTSSTCVGLGADSVQSALSFHVGSKGPPKAAFTYKLTRRRPVGLTPHVLPSAVQFSRKCWLRRSSGEHCPASEVLSADLALIRIKREPCPSTPIPAIRKPANDRTVECMAKEPEQGQQLFSVQSFTHLASGPPVCPALPGQTLGSRWLWGHAGWVCVPGGGTCRSPS